MRIMAGVLLATFAFALPVAAQTVAQPAKATENAEKLWKIETSGINGWGAASQAKRVRDILDTEKSIKNLVFDTTGIGYFELAGKKAPELAELNLLLSKKRAGGVTITRLTEVDVPKAEIIYELAVSGLGWMGTAIETRDVLSKLEGVIRVHPNGLNGKALVYVKDKKAFTEAAAKTALGATAKLRLRKFEVATSTS